jgi:prepilin-type processing-associated H-X9-DG protein
VGFLVGESVVLANTFTVAGVNTDPTAVTLAVTDPAGAITTYTHPASITKTAVGIYTKTITATAAGTWVYVWTGTDTAADIAPGFFTVSPVTFSYVTLAELRALPNLADTAKFTNAELVAATDWFETLFEDYTGVAWVPRTATDERHSGNGNVVFLDHLFPRTITAVRSYSDAATSTAYTANELADLRLEPSGAIRRNTLGWFTSAYGLIAVDYTHGWDAPPADVIEAAKVAIRAHLIDDYQANRQFAVSTEAGIIRTSQPGEGRPFGLPEVDAVANRRNHRCPSVA